MVNSLKLTLVAIAGLAFLSGCSNYSPLKDTALRPQVSDPGPGPGVTATFLGNTTILVSDGETNLIVDGFLSRPGLIRSLIGRVRPNRAVIERELRDVGISGLGSLDAVLVGHAHHDHALDAVAVAGMTGAQVMGSESYRFIHEGNNGKTDSASLFIVPTDGTTRTYGQFTVTFLPSSHVGSHNFVSHRIEGDIDKPLEMPARIWRFKTGDVFAIHIAHRHGKLLVTTTAGVQIDGALGYKADVVFLGVGFLNEESQYRRDAYWTEYVERPDPELVVPVHWDNFSRPLSRPLKPPRLLAGGFEESMRIIKEKGRGRQLRVLDRGESIRLLSGVLQ